MPSVWTVLTLLVLSQAPAALAACAIEPDANGHVTIPDGQTSIADNAFESCTTITSISIPNTVTSIGAKAFYWSSLSTISIPNSVTSIGSKAFSYTNKLSSITIPDSVTSLGNSAFDMAIALTNVTIGKNVRIISEDAFRDCKSLTSISIPNTVTSIGPFAFKDSGLQTLTIPDSVTYLGYSLCRSCTSLTSVIIGNNVTNIDTDTFRGCTSLTSVSIGNSVTTIGWTAFDGCTSLTSVSIPNTVTTLKPYSFAKCTSLTSVTLTESITDWPTYDLQAPFGDTAINQVCGVDATQAPFSGQPQLQVQDTQAQCTEPVCADGVSGVKWCRPPACASPDTTGYAVTETDLELASFDVTATCAPLYVGTASVGACSADGEAYSLSGCSCGGFTENGVCQAYRTTCPDNEYLSLDGTATTDHSCIPCAADEKSYGGAPCKKVVDCLSATEQGHRNIDVGYENGDYAVSMS